MSRYSGPRLRLVRSLGALPGLTQKECKRTSAPGQHGQAKKKLSDYAIQLREKQKLRYNYGVNETQLRNMYKKALRSKKIIGHALLSYLEMRLDNIVFRLGFAPTIPAARQLVRHGHIMVNGKPVNIPSQQLKAGQKITAKKSPKAEEQIRKSLQKPSFILPTHLERADDALEGTVKEVCPRENVLLEIDESRVIGYYSKNS